MNDILNYLDDPSHKAMYSPSTLVASATNIPPFILFTSDSDPVPFEITDNMTNALLGRGAVAEEHHVPGGDHAFIYWHETDKQGLCVSTEVTNFFATHQ